MGTVIFESRIRGAILANLSRTVKFRNGQLVLRDNDPIIKELEDDPEYGKEFARFGELNIPSKFEPVQVTRSSSTNAPSDSSSRIPAGRGPTPPVQEAPRRGRPPKDPTT